MREKDLLRSALRSLKAGILQALESEPMFAQILMNLEYKVAPVGTCAVDGKRFLYNPEFLFSQTILDRSFIIAHEALHMAFLHPYQMRDALKADPKFDLDVANEAMDYVINSMLRSTRHHIPSDALFSHRFKHDMSWESVYHILMRERKESEQSNGRPGASSSSDSGNDSESICTGSGSKPESDSERQPSAVSRLGSGSDSSKGSGASGGGNDESVPTDCQNHSYGGVIPAEDDAKAEIESRQQIVQVTEVCRRAGNIPSALRKQIDLIFDVVDSPSQVLQEHIQRVTSSNVSFIRPSRRHSNSELIFPGHDKDFVIQNGVFAFDVSGSVNKEMCERHWLHAYNILGEYSGNIFFAFCDASLPDDNITEISCDEIEETLPEFSGGGGTKFKPVFDWIEKDDIEPDFLVYFTDMYAGDWDKLSEPDYPVIFMAYETTYEQDDIPFGILINLD